MRLALRESGHAEQHDDHWNYNSAENLYIQSAELNGKPYTKSFITHKHILAGGTLKLVMGNQPNTAFGAAAEDRPKSMVY